MLDLSKQDALGVRVRATAVARHRARQGVTVGGVRREGPGESEGEAHGEAFPTEMGCGSSTPGGTMDPVPKLTPSWSRRKIDDPNKYAAVNLTHPVAGAPLSRRHGHGHVHKFRRVSGPLTRATRACSDRGPQAGKGEHCSGDRRGELGPYPPPPSET